MAKRRLPKRLLDTAKMETMGHVMDAASLAGWWRCSETGWVKRQMYASHCPGIVSVPDWLMAMAFDFREATRH